MSDYKLIPLGKRGQFGFTKVDEAQFEYLSQWTWHLSSTGYARRISHRTKKSYFMHRVINETPEGALTDHINGDRLDNRQINLRTCSYRENASNKSLQNNTSGYKGVIWNKSHQTWYARINSSGKHYHLGSYKTPREAAIAYNKAALKIHGNFSKLNLVGA